MSRSSDRLAIASSNGRPDPMLQRVDALAATELALGADRRDLALRLTLVAVGVLAELDAHGLGTNRVADRLEDLAEKLRS